MEDYKVIRAIGKGSFGKVYLVKHVAEARQYVMKVIKLKGIPAKEREACRNEVMLMQKLQHPNIVAYKDSFFANGRDNLCIVMTYCDGGDLAERVAAAKATLFKEDLIMHWFVQMVLAINHMHERKVLHRDIKTQNVFLLGNGRLVLGDLGISKVLDGTMAFARTQIGTPYYMSPELFRNAPYDYKSDVWALGCVLYELCTLNHPFEGTSLHGLAAKISTGRYTPINAKYSQSLRALIASMLALDPKARPTTTDILQQPYLKKHVYNFVKDVVERSAMGVGTVPATPRPGASMGAGATAAHAGPFGIGGAGGLGPALSIGGGGVGVGSGILPISEGTMMFRAAAMKASGVSGAAMAASDAMAKAIAAGLGPHANNLQQQLVGLGLQAVVAKALQDAGGGGGTAVPLPTAPAAAVPTTTVATALSGGMGGGGAVPAPARLPGPGVGVAPRPFPTPTTASPAAGLAPTPAPTPSVIAPRPISPHAARRVVKESQAALDREEERMKQVEAALARLREEKALRDRQREEFKKKQERIAVRHASHLPSGGGGGGGGLGGMAAVPPSSGVSRPGARPLPPVGVSRVPASNGMAGGEARVGGGGGGGHEDARAVALRERFNAIRRDKPSGTPTTVAVGGGGRGGGGVVAGGQRPPVQAPTSGGGGPPPPGPSALSAEAFAARRAEADRRRVASLDEWEREKVGRPHAKAVASGGTPVAIPAGRKPSPGPSVPTALKAAPTAAPTRTKSDGYDAATVASSASSVSIAPAPTAAGGMRSPAAIVPGGGGGWGFGSKPTGPPVLARASSGPTLAAPATSVPGRAPSPLVVPSGITAASSAPASSAPIATLASQPQGPGVAGKPSPVAMVPVGGVGGGSHFTPPAAIPALARAGSGSGVAPAHGAPPVPVDATPLDIEAFLPDNYGDLDARSKVLARKDAARRAEESRQKAAFRAAAAESVAERQHAAYRTAAQYHGVGVALAGALPIHDSVLHHTAQRATALLTTLESQLPGARYASHVAGGGVGRSHDLKEVDEGEEGEEVEVPDAIKLVPPAAAVTESGCELGGELPSESKHEQLEEEEEEEEEEDTAGCDGGLDESGGYAEGHLPDTDSEDSIILEAAAEDEAEARAAVGPTPQPVASKEPVLPVVAQVGGGGLVGRTRPRIRLATAEEDEADIREQEAALRAELMRSTMRMDGLRQSLEVARKMAVDAGVHFNRGGHPTAMLHAAVAMGGGGQHVTRPPLPLSHGSGAPVISSRMSAAAAINQDAMTGVSSAGASEVGGGRTPVPLSAADDRPIRPSKRAGVFGDVELPPPAPSRDHGAGSGPNASPAPDAGATPEPAPPPAAMSLVTPSPVGGPPIPTDTEYDEDDIGDDDGNEEGGVSFQLIPDTIAEVAEEDEEEEGEGGGGPGVFHTGHLMPLPWEPNPAALPPGGRVEEGGEAVPATAPSTSYPPAPGSEGVDRDPLAALHTLHHASGGAMSDRVETYRKVCMAGLGPDAFDRLYTALKAHLYGDMDDGGEAAGPGGGASDTEVALQHAKAALPPGKESYIEHVATLLNMEEQLL